MTEPSYFLTRDELADLCESRRCARQVEHLRRIGVPFHLTPSGRPVVTRKALEGGRETAKQKNWEPALG